VAEQPKLLRKQQDRFHPEIAHPPTQSSPSKLFNLFSMWTHQAIMQTK
jgi:hypothetical protein